MINIRENSFDTNWDLATGKGKPGTPFEFWFLCDGRNGLTISEEENVPHTQPLTGFSGTPPKQSFAELLHNLIGHPLLAICNALHLYRLGTFIHDKVFKF